MRFPPWDDVGRLRVVAQLIGGCARSVRALKSPGYCAIGIFFPNCCQPKRVSGTARAVQESLSFNLKWLQFFFFLIELCLWVDENCSVLTRSGIFQLGRVVIICKCRHIPPILQLSNFSQTCRTSENPTEGPSRDLAPFEFQCTRRADCSIRGTHELRQVNNRQVETQTKFQDTFGPKAGQSLVVHCLCCTHTSALLLLLLLVLSLIISR